VASVAAGSAFFAGALVGFAFDLLAPAFDLSVRFKATVPFSVRLGSARRRASSDTLRHKPRGW
jgi:hypothetical protein